MEGAMCKVKEACGNLLNFANLNRILKRSIKMKLKPRQCTETRFLIVHLNMGFYIMLN